MKRSLAMLGLVSLLGCGGTDTEDTSSTTATTGAAFAESGDQRVGRFELMPESAIARKSIVPQAWARETDVVERVEGAEAVGHFNPEMARQAEAYRRTMRPTGGVR